MTESHITKLDKCISDCVIAPIVITVEKDDSIKPLKRTIRCKTDKQAIFQKKNCQGPNVDELIDGVSHIGTENKEGTLYFRVLDLKYAFSQLKLAADTARQ